MFENKEIINTSVPKGITHVSRNRSMTNEYIPYVYIVKNKTTKMKYIGVRYARGCNPNDLWVTYFTSSKLVKKLIENFGKEDFIVKVLHTFPNDPAAAVLREAEYFKYIKKRDDYLNMTYSSGCQDLRISSKGGKVGGNIVYHKKIGIFRSEEDRKKWASMGGEAGSKKQIEQKIGIHGQTPEERKMFAKMGNARVRELGKGRFCRKTQSELGKRGGPKNKGFRWYNDGERDYKYTKKQQDDKDFQTFVEENGFSVGRMNQNTKNRIWVNDGKSNFMIYQEDFNKDLHNTGRLGDRRKYNGHKNKENN